MSAPVFAEVVIVDETPEIRSLEVDFLGEDGAIRTYATTLIRGETPRQVAARIGQLFRQIYARGLDS